MHADQTLSVRVARATSRGLRAGSSLGAFEPTATGAPSEIARVDPLLQQSGGPKPLAVGGVQDLLNLKTEARGRDVHELEGADRMPEPELAGEIDVLGRRDT